MHGTSYRHNTSFLDRLYVLKQDVVSAHEANMHHNAIILYSATSCALLFI